MTGGTEPLCACRQSSPAKARNDAGAGAAILLSLVLHLWAVKASFHDQLDRLPESHESLLVVVPPPDAMPARRASPGAARAKPRGTSRGKALSMKELLPDWGGAGQITEGRVDAPDQDTGDANGNGGLNGIGNLGAYRYIQETIEAQLVYPEDFTKRGIEGAVRADLVFSRDGKFLGAESSVRSASRYLAVLVRRTLRRAFSDPLPSTMRFTAGLTHVKASFAFDIVHGDHRGRSPSSSLSPNSHLEFVRTFQTRLPIELDRALFQRGEKGGVSVGLDMLWIGDQLQRLFSPDEIDPLEKYRQDPDW